LKQNLRVTLALVVRALEIKGVSVDIINRTNVYYVLILKKKNPNGYIGFTLSRNRWR